MLPTGSIGHLSLLLICLSCVYVSTSSALTDRGHLAQTERNEEIASSLLTRQSATSPFTGENFVRLGFHASIVVGDTLYIDGGEASWTSNGANISQVPNNNTLSIDLSKSWSPSTATINTIAKDDVNIPVLNYEALWDAGDNESFYMWGGAVSRSIGSADGRNHQNGLFQFKNGNWSEVTMNAGSIFATLNRPAAGMIASGNGVGYYLGGYNSEVDPESNGPFSPDTGLVTYNMSDNTWRNVTSEYDSTGTAFMGALKYAPSFGSEGLLIAFGGEASQPTAWQDNGDLFQPFSSIAVYDPSGSGKWYSQQATGDFPPNSDMFCAVGVQSDQGTYEIFTYGGHNDSYINGMLIPDTNQRSEQQNFNGVYVLSLPGFVWFKANDTSAKPRTGHTCELAGKRQMISIGGLDPSSAATVNFFPLDTNPQGLGIFDMVKLNWTNQYDATADPYTLPDPIKAWYSDPNSNSSVDWNSTELKDLFLGTSTTASPGTTSSPTAAPSSSSSSSSDHAGVIAGAVVGGVLGLALIAAAVWLISRRRRYQRQPVPSELSNEHKLNEAPNNARFPSDKARGVNSRGAGGGYVVSEIGGQQVRPELDNRPVSRGPVRRTELESPQSPRQPTHELDSAT